MWTVVVLLRKAALVAATSLLHDRPEASARAAVGVLALGLGLHGFVRPHAPMPESVSHNKRLGWLCVHFARSPSHPLPPP